MPDDRKRLQTHLSPFLLLEYAAQDFSRGVSRNGIDEFDFPHLLVASNLSIDPHQQFILGQVLVARPENHKSFWYLACFLIRLGNDRYIGNGNMLEQQRF